MRKSIFIGTGFALIFTFTLSIAGAADLNQKSGSATIAQKIKSQTVLPATGSVTAKPMVTEIKINPNLIKLSMPPISDSEFQAAIDWAQKARVQWKYIEGSADWQAKKCAAKSYSVAEQQAAGCMGSDTVDVCAQKLYHHCMQTGTYHSSYMSKLKTMMDAVDNLIKKSTLYRNGLNEAEKKYQ
jgi:hypothetical protein